MFLPDMPVTRCSLLFGGGLDRTDHFYEPQARGGPAARGPVAGAGREIRGGWQGPGG